MTMVTDNVVGIGVGIGLHETENNNVLATNNIINGIYYSWWSGHISAC